MEFTSLEPLPILVFTNLVMIAFLLLLGRKGLKEPYSLSRWRRYLMVITSMVFCLFSFWGTDWFHYAEKYINVLYVSGYNTALEDVYVLIANISPNYLVFRAIIWGLALWLLLLLFRRVSVSTDLLLSIFCGIWLIYFGYGRIVTAYTLMFLGGLALSKPIKGKILLSLLLGGGLLLASLFFHKTAFFGVAIVLIALLPRLLNKRTFILLLLIYPFVLLLVQLLLLQFMDAALDTNDNNASSVAGQFYLNEDASEMGIAYLLLLLLQFAPYYMAAWIGYKVNVLQQPEDDTEEETEGQQAELRKVAPSDIRFFSRTVVYIVLVSTIFLFDLGANTLVFYIRFMMFGFIPAAIVLAWAWEHGCCPRMVKYTYLVGLAGTFYALLYSFYVSYLGVAA